MLESIKDDVVAALKVTLAWVLTAWGHITTISSAELASWLAIVYTIASLYVLVRDKIIKRRVRRSIRSDSDYTTL